MGLFDAEVTAAASEFWNQADVRGPHPRDLEPAVFIVLPLAVLRLPQLRLTKAISWLNRRGIAHPKAVPDRPLHGYLVARGGTGVVFLDGTDSPDEQRFSLAHEVAHFMYDYLKPRMSALRALGGAIQDVLDGKRFPTPEERLAGVLRGVPLGVYSHLGRRSNEGAITSLEAIHIEDRADQLALELLAPLGSVLSSIRKHGSVELSVDSLATLLEAQYRLPCSVSQIYARTVVIAARSRQSFRDWLGM